MMVLIQASHLPPKPLTPKEVGHVLEPLPPSRESGGAADAPLSSFSAPSHQHDCKTYA